MTNECNTRSHCVCKIALALGLTSALFVFLLGILATYLSQGVPIVDFLGHVYVGYEATLVGSFVGAAFAFLHTFLFFFVAGLIYKGLVKCCPSSRKCCNKKDEEAGCH